MTGTIEWLNTAIDCMVSERTPRHAAPVAPSAEIGPEEVALLQMAASLKSLAPQRAEPRPSFVSTLKSAMLAQAAGETDRK